MKAEKSKNLVKAILPSLISFRNNLGFKGKDFLSYLYIHNLKSRRPTVENIKPPKFYQCISDSTLPFCK